MHSYRYRSVKMLHKRSMHQRAATVTPKTASRLIMVIRIQTTTVVLALVLSALVTASGSPLRQGKQDSVRSHSADPYGLDGSWREKRAEDEEEQGNVTSTTDNDSSKSQSQSEAGSEEDSQEFSEGSKSSDSTASDDSSVSQSQSEAGSEKSSQEFSESSESSSETSITDNDSSKSHFQSEVDSDEGSQELSEDSESSVNSNTASDDSSVSQSQSEQSTESQESENSNDSLQDSQSELSGEESSEQTGEDDSSESKSQSEAGSEEGSQDVSESSESSSVTSTTNNDSSESQSQSEAGSEEGSQDVSESSESTSVTSTTDNDSSESQSQSEAGSEEGSQDVSESSESSSVTSTTNNDSSESQSQSEVDSEEGSHELSESSVNSTASDDSSVSQSQSEQSTESQESKNSNDSLQDSQTELSGEESSEQTGEDDSSESQSQPEADSEEGSQDVSESSESTGVTSTTNNDSSESQSKSKVDSGEDSQEFTEGSESSVNSRASDDSSVSLSQSEAGSEKSSQEFSESSESSSETSITDNDSSESQSQSEQSTESQESENSNDSLQDSQSELSGEESSEQTGEDDSSKSQSQSEASSEEGSQDVSESSESSSVTSTTNNDSSESQSKSKVDSGEDSQEFTEGSESSVNSTASDDSSVSQSQSEASSEESSQEFSESSESSSETSTTDNDSSELQSQSEAGSEEGSQELSEDSESRVNSTASDDNSVSQSQSETGSEEDSQEFTEGSESSVNSTAEDDSSVSQSQSESGSGEDSQEFTEGSESSVNSTAEDDSSVSQSQSESGSEEDSQEFTEGSESSVNSGDGSDTEESITGGVSTSESGSDGNNSTFDCNENPRLNLPNGNIGDMINSSCFEEHFQGTWECVYDSTNNTSSWNLTLCLPVDNPPIVVNAEALAVLIHSGNISVEEAIEDIASLVERIVSGTPNTTQAKSSAVEVLELSSDILSQGTVPKNTGSALLSILDVLALRVFDEEVSIETENILLAVKKFVSGGTNQDSSITAIEFQGSSIVLPPELVATQLSSGRIASFYFNDLSGLLPGSLEKDNTTVLLSPVVSSKLWCGRDELQCDTRDLNLTVPVRITLIHPQAEDEDDTYCAFWEFVESDEPDSPLTGYWSQEGCTKNLEASTATKTVCECTHLTHFAVLLSPGAEYDSDHVLALQIIGYVGVSISLLALLITILTFAMLRSLWTMRNYIHVNLCISLMIAQLVFVIGVDKTENSNGCAVVAVLLHYFFLVTFMWMLMEGAVLYVVLVKVFVAGLEKRYLILFTTLSYGVPALYMGLSVPLGFLLNNTRHYGSDSACWLRYDTHFVWAFIAPVLLIILINTGFFIMVIVIMRRHQSRKAGGKKITNMKQWLKASISLLVVMGITWVVGILAFHEDLLPIAYVFTIMVAFQGLAIFIVFVLLSKQVRDAYITWLKARVEGSDVLSEHFGNKLNSLTTSTARSRRESNARYYLDMRRKSRSSNSSVLSLFPESQSGSQYDCSVYENSAVLGRIEEGNGEATSGGDAVEYPNHVYDLNEQEGSPGPDSGAGGDPIYDTVV